MIRWIRRASCVPIGSGPQNQKACGASAALTDSNRPPRHTNGRPIFSRHAARSLSPQALGEEHAGMTSRSMDTLFCGVALRNHLTALKYCTAEAQRTLRSGPGKTCEWFSRMNQHLCALESCLDSIHTMGVRNQPLAREAAPSGQGIQFSPGFRNNEPDGFFLVLDSISL